MLNKKKLSAKGLTFALLALGGIGLANHNSHAHASTVKPSITYSHHDKAQANTRQMNFLAHPKTQKIAKSQRTPRIVTARGMVKPQRVNRMRIQQRVRAQEPQARNINAQQNRTVNHGAQAIRKVNNSHRIINEARGLSLHETTKQQTQNTNFKHFMQQRKSDRAGVKWNTRDLGNYRVKGGVIKPHLIYRSSRLNTLSPAQVQKLQKMGVTKIIDLRQKTDRMSHFDTDEQGGRIPGTKISYEIAPVFTRAQRRQMGKISNFYKGPAVDNARAKKSYRKVFRTLLNNKGATLFHCDSGQDRTGVVSALVMSSLGANRNEVTNDYLLSNAYRRHPQSIQAQKSQINNFFNVINHQYGNMNNYLHKGLGLNNKQLRQLRNKYVQKVGTKKATTLRQTKVNKVAPKLQVNNANKRQNVTFTKPAQSQASTFVNNSTHSQSNMPILDVLGAGNKASSATSRATSATPKVAPQSKAQPKINLQAIPKANATQKKATKPVKKQQKQSNVFTFKGKYSINKNTWKADQVPSNLRRYLVSPSKVGMHFSSNKGWSNPGVWSVNFANSYFHKIWNTKNGVAYGNGNSLNHGWHHLMKGYMTKNAHVGAMGSSTNRALTGGNQFGHSFVVQHVFKNGYALIVEQNWPKMTGYRGGNVNRWNYAVIPSRMSRTTYFMPRGYRLNMGNKVHKVAKKRTRKPVKTQSEQAQPQVKNQNVTPQSTPQSASSKAQSATSVSMDNITRVLNHVTYNVQQQQNNQSTRGQMKSVQAKPTIHINTLRQHPQAIQRTMQDGKKVTFMSPDGNDVIEGHATLKQLNADKKLPKNTVIVNNNPRVIKNNLSESYRAVLKQINGYRAKNGLKPLRTTRKLNKLASMRANQLEQHWGHYYKGVTLEDDDARKLGLFKTNRDASYHLSENIAQAPLSPNAVLPSDPKTYRMENGSSLANATNDAMYNYDAHESNWSHRINILNPYATKVGIGTRYNSKTGSYEITEDFYQPKEITSNAQYNATVNAAMKSLSRKDYNESEKLACQHAGRNAKNRVLARHGTKKQANQAYRNAFIKMMKSEIKK